MCKYAQVFSLSLSSVLLLLLFLFISFVGCSTPGVVAFARTDVARDVSSAASADAAAAAVTTATTAQGKLAAVLGQEVVNATTNEGLSMDPREPFPESKSESESESKSESKSKSRSEHMSYKAALTAAEFVTFGKSLEHVRGVQCKKDLNATFWGIRLGQQWATAMYDATVKSAVGLESAVLYQFGHYDQCLDQQKFNDQSAQAAATAGSMPVRAKYCLVDVAIEGLTVHDVNSRSSQAAAFAHWGACVPASCGDADIAAHLSVWLQQRVLSGDNGQLEGQAPICQSHAYNELHVTKAMLVYASVLCFFVLLAVLSTVYHGYLLWSVAHAQQEADMKTLAAQRKRTLVMALLSFSVIENTKKLFQASKDQLGLNSINGIKALAMLFILAGHALSFILGGPMYNAKFINEQLRAPTFSFLTNSLLFVDTFLLLSGFLFCRILLIELERRRGRLNVFVLYVARYIRLTPAYMAIIGFYMTWFPYVGSGPIWSQRIGLEQARCQASWWLNILYINNYINTDKLCMFQSWYLSVDSQLFFGAPIVIYLLYRARRSGLHFLYALVALTALTPFAVTYLAKLDPTLMVYADEVHDLARNAFYISSYIKTHMRASAYVIGLLVGYLVHLMQEKSIQLPRQWVRLLWICASFVGIASMYGVTRFYVASYTLLESSLYAGFHKLGWNLAVGWLVLAATTGHAGWLQRLLSKRLFAPISRLTYCAYLSNGIVELYHMASIRHPHYMGYLPLTNDVLSHTLNTFLLAFVLCLLFESPIHALERILLRSFARKESPRGNRNVEKATGKETPSTSEEQVP